MKEDLLKIINHYGVNHQQRKLEEEVFELQEAITNYENAKIVFGKHSTLKNNHIAEEIADVVVILKQLQYYYEIDDLEVEHIAASKIFRQLERIDAEKKV